MALSTVNITYIQNNGGVVTTTTVSVPLPPVLIGFDSPQQASQQSGFSALDIAARNILRAGGFTDLLGNFIPREQIQKITVR